MDRWETREQIAAALNRFESAIPGWVRPRAHGLVSDGEIAVWNVGTHMLPAAVMAGVLGHLAVLAQIDRDRAPLITRAAARYQATFEAHVPADQLRYRVAAVVVSLATGSHRVQEAGWPAATRRRLELAERWLTAARTVRQMSDISRPAHGHPMLAPETPR